MFQLLNVIRVYTKAPGRRTDLSAPFVLKRGATVQDAARAVHKDFGERLKYARIWGSRAFEGQMVQREHILEDGDVLELHA
jgi:ribosome-interacting GTPase 1